MVSICCGDIIFSGIQAVLFDKDGTLANVEAFLLSLGRRRSRLIDAQVPGVQEPLNLAFGIDNNQLNPNGLLAIGTRQENAIAAAAYVAETGRDWLDALALVQKSFAEADRGIIKAEQTPLFAGALTFIQTLAATNLKLGMLSSDTSNNVKEFLARYQLSSYFHLQWGADGQLTKPDPVLLQKACSTLQVDPQVTLVIGDSQADIQLAQQAGAAGCIAANWGWTTNPTLTGADVVVADFSQIQVMV